ncbi:MAG TPA: IS1380 family transposase [Gemmataceae bacterium]|nr:IS1380 family transposase [Gemmataceae bacterium]
MVAARSNHSTLFPLGSQPIQVVFDAGCLVADAGLLPVRALERSLGILDDLAARLPDPRSLKFVRHSKRALLTQQVYQILAGCPDCNDAPLCRDDPLFQILADVAPDPEQPLASGSTLARFQYAYTRRQAAEGEPEVLLQQRAAQTARLKILNDYLIELFIRTRTTVPTEIVLDLDATDDPVHGRQALSGYHGYYRQHQYLPLLAFEGHSGFPLAAWLRPGTVHAACGVVEVVQALVTRLRQVWPDVVIRLRGDTGLAVPRLYDYCEDAGLTYALGFAGNAVLHRATATALGDLQLYYACYGRCDPHVQRFENLRDYQADSWRQPRRIVAKVEINPQGCQRRYVVTNLEQPADEVYRDFYVQRGKVPEQPIGELKNGLQADRLSACGFCANSWRLLVHVVAYAIVVVFREANAAVPEVATAQISTLRQRLWKVGAVLCVGVRRIVVHVSATWPGRELWGRVEAAVASFVSRLGGGERAASPPRAVLPM